MAFWGVEVKPGKPYTHPSGSSCGRLRVSQATLGIGSSDKKSLVQCNVGKKSPVLLCSLLPDKSEYCHLDLEFEEADEVVFSVIGPRSVHLTGYYLSTKSRHGGFDNSSESYGEDIGDADTDTSNDISDEGDYEDSFINDDAEALSASPAPSSEDEEVKFAKKPTEKKPKRRRLRKMRELSDSEDDETLAQQNMANRHDPIQPPDSDDEDDHIPISSLTNGVKDVDKGKLADEKIERTLVDSTGEDFHDTEKSQNNPKVDDADLKSNLDLLPNAMLDTSEAEGSKINQKKRKRRSSKSVEDKTPESDIIKQDNASEAKLEIEVKPESIKGGLFSKKEDLDLETDRTKDGCTHPLPDEPQSDEKKIKKKKRKIEKEKGDKMKETKAVSENDVDGAGVDIKACQAKVLSNGLVIEELLVGSPDGVAASSGKKVTIHYVGKLKEGNHVYDSTTSGDPFKFRLGKGRAIDGLDLGIDGMRVGGKRRLTIPPELGYGTEGMVDSVPPNSWLILDVELLRVR